MEIAYETAKQSPKDKKVDSKEKVDCHADFQSARNDRKNTPSKKRILATTPHSHCETSAGSRGNPKKVDSRRNAKNASEQPKDSRKTAQNLKATILQTPQNKQAEVVFDSESQAAESAKSAQKPTPKQTTSSTDILTCLANLSTDEVFTPPHIVNAMLDLLPQELFSDPSATFLDPACKSGVFLREIARRLMLGLEPHFPEPSKRIAHILTHQLYGIAITELTALLSRRTLYGSKDVDNHRYSIPKKAGAALPQGGNIYYAPTPHSFKNAKCTYCGASQSQYDRDSTLESYAYAFIHELEPLEKFFAKAKAHFPSSQAQAQAFHANPVIANEVKQSTNPRKVDCHDLPSKSRNDKQSHPQGVPMSFSVIIGNPPYQLSDGGDASSDAAIPIYHKFIQRAKELNPNHIVFIIPSRWMVGGRGLDRFRQEMINDQHIKTIIDYEDSKACFPDNNIDGGVCIFHRDKEHKKKITYIYNPNNLSPTRIERSTLANIYSNFIVRDNRVLSILDKVCNGIMFDTIVLNVRPYGIRGFLFNEPERFPNANLQDTPFLHSVKIYGVKGHKGGGQREFQAMCLSL